MAALCRLLSLVFVISSATLFTVSRATGDPKAEVDPYKYEDNGAEGPKAWGTLKPEWQTCSNGKLQSPIDMTNARVQVLPNLGPLDIWHKAAPAKVVNRGHDIALEWEGDAGSLKINGSDYKLLNIHFHSPSEHTIEGKSYDLEGHMVHQRADQSIAVVGILYRLGRPDPLLEKLLPGIKTVGANGTTDEGQSAKVGIIAPGETRFNRNGYYRYIGSLTTPPCTEGVIWSLATEVRSVSTTQLEALKAAVHDGYEKNARPVQEINGRTINLASPNDNSRL